MKVQSKHKLLDKMSRLLVLLVIISTAVGAVILFYRGETFEGWVGLAALAIFIGVQVIVPIVASMSNPALMRLVLSIIMLSSQTVGRYFSLYKRIPHYDKLQHFLFGIVLAIIGLVVLYRLTPIGKRRNQPLHPAGLGLFISGQAMLALFAWELFEYGCDRLFDTDMQDWKAGSLNGLNDTMLDLMIGLVGAILAATLIMHRFSQNRTKFYDTWLADFFTRSE